MLGLRFTILITTFLMLSVTAYAAPLTLALDVTIRQIVVGSTDDPAGMDGATVHFSATFADGAVWQDSGFGVGEVFAVAESHTFTIAGASVAASNGTYSDPSGFLINAAPGIGAEFLSLPYTDFEAPEIMLDSGHLFGMGFVLSPVSIADHPAIGDFVDESHFAETFSFDTIFYDTLASSSPTPNFYEIDSVVEAPNIFGGPTDPKVSPIPLPATFTLFIPGLAFLGFAMKRRRSVQQQLG